MVSLEVACGSPAMPNILTSSDGDYWRLVRGSWMKCFTSTNLKRVNRLVLWGGEGELGVLRGESPVWVCERCVPWCSRG